MSGAGGEHLACRTDGRRTKIRKARLNGIDGVEVSDDGLTLTVTFLGKAPYGLGPENIRIDGGRRITGITAVDVEVDREDDPDLDDRLHITLDRAGDTSPYRLAIVEAGPGGDRPGTTPFPGFDQRYYRATFTFRPNCPSPFDCADECARRGEDGGAGCLDGRCACGCGAGDARDGCDGCDGCDGGDDGAGCGAGAGAGARAGADCADDGHGTGPVVDYTARDYETIRRQLLDRLALTTPNWVERNPADLGVTLVELLAATGDRIGYQQDAVATEAYLDTARRRVSVRRHVRLIDYPMHDGCNARALVTIEVREPVTLPPGTFRFAAIDPGRGDAVEIAAADPGTVLTERELSGLEEHAAIEIFEPVRADASPAGAALRLRPAHNAIRFWTWGDEQCLLRKGATSATLRDAWLDEGRTRRALDLRPGDLLILEEVRDPRTGAPGGDPRRRQAVRLTEVTRDVDYLCDQPVVTVEWADEDALTRTLRLSTVGGRDCAPIPDVTVARGNVVLVDHGRSLTWGGSAPETVQVPAPPPGDPACGPPAFGCPDPRPPRLPAPVPRPRPVLRHSPVAQAVRFPDPARVAAGQAARLAEIPERVRGRLADLWRSARDHGELSDAEIDELAVLFGAATLDRFGLREHPVRALRALLHAADRLLAGKRRRLDVLVARARAGTVLDDHVAWEIARSWGPAYAEGLDPGDPVSHGPAVAALTQDPRRALPAVRITAREGRGTHVWTPRRDLLDSGPRDRHFVGELGDDGRLSLRFGDGRHGAAPPPGTRLEIDYRVGGGTAGNVGADAIRHLVLSDLPGLSAGSDAADGPGGSVGSGESIASDAAAGPDTVAGPARAIVAVRNPLPATGGTEPEPVETVRRLAPLDVRRRRLRAVTADDYAALAAKVPGVRRAATEIRWTGSLAEAHVAIDACRTGTPSPDLLDAVAYFLARYRRIGHDVVVVPARPVPLDIALEVCAAPGHRHGRILAEVHRALGRRTLPGGRRGFFHPDALTFGEPVRVSRLVAAAAAVPGVVSVRVTRLRRLGGEDAGELDAGVLRPGPLEIAQCDNDADRPEGGRLTIDLIGEAATR